MGVIRQRQPNKDDCTHTFVSNKVAGLHTLFLISMPRIVVREESEPVASLLGQSGGIGRRDGFKMRLQVLCISEPQLNIHRKYMNNNYLQLIFHCFHIL